MMIRRFVLVSLLLAPPAFGADGPAGLKAGPGLDVVETSCGLCHTVDYIRMNSTFLTPDAWKAEVTKMRTAFGAPIDDDAAATILAYLSKQYAVPGKP
jgi:mono/diheme cytochrome c family protein